jgi:hypothetical protein
MKRDEVSKGSDGTYRFGCTGRHNRPEAKKAASLRKRLQLPRLVGRSGAVAAFAESE